MRFLVGLIVGILLGAAATAAGQWSYVGVYTAQELARSAPATAQIYAIGVYDGLVAQQYHVTGGGGGKRIWTGRGHVCVHVSTTRSFRNGYKQS